MEKNRPLFIGVDVAKDQLDIAFSNGARPQRVRNDAPHRKRLIEELGVLAPALVLLEATGGYEKPLVYALEAARLPYRVANPRLVRDFARAEFTRERDDFAALQLLCEFGGPGFGLSGAAGEDNGMTSHLPRIQDHLESNLSILLPE